MLLFHLLKSIINQPLNSENKLGAVIRFFRWQFGSRLVQGDIIFKWVNGCKFIVKTGETGFTGNIYDGLTEFPDMGFLLHFLRPEDHFVDIGANVGSYTVLACSVVGAKGVAFEPVPSTFNRLVGNIRINNSEEKVTCLNMGLGGQQGTLDFTSDSDTTNHALAPNEQCANKISVEVTTLDAALQGSPCPALMKIDVEGYETLVLSGAGETLKNPNLHAVIMELNGSGNHYGFDESKIMELMLGLGFKTYSYNPLTRSLISLDGKNLNSGNTLFIRSKEFVEERLRSAAKVSVNGREF